jgi:hypothetical protein
MGGEIQRGRAPATLESGVLENKTPLLENKTPLVELEHAKVRRYACLATRV